MFYFLYYFPLGLQLRPRRPTWAVWMIIGACAGTFALQKLVPIFFWVNQNALIYRPSSPSPSSLVLNAYLHGGWLHLVSNMLTLAVFGPALEERLGARRFLVLYHLCNVFANLVQGAFVLLAMPAWAGAGVLGASGAIAGLLGLFSLRLPFARLRVGYWAFMPLQAFTRCGTATIPAGVAVLLWFVLQAGMAVVQLQGGGGGVAVGSHLGGLAAGVGLALLLHLRDAARAEAHLDRGRRYLDRALWYPAQGEFIEYVRCQPQDEQGHLELARTYRLTGRNVLGDEHYRIACHLVAATKQLDRVEEIYREAEKGSPTFVLGAAQQLQLAQAQERSLRRTSAACSYERFAHHHPEAAAAPLALYRAARLRARRPDGAPDAEVLYQRLIEHYPLAAEAGLARNAIRILAAAA